jgi:EAL domain-containing protein (putative c-di-GMP-specific phosphodiesterase class I)
MAEAVLVEAHCDAAQGFLVGRPMEESEITAVLKQQIEVRPDDAADQQLTGSI